jgi:hypothetical protein
MQRERRIVFRRTESTAPPADRTAEEPTVLVVNFLTFVGAGWHTTADAMLANTSAAMAREPCVPQMCCGSGHGVLHGPFQ